MPKATAMPQIGLGDLSQIIPYVGDIRAIIAATKSNEELGDKIKEAAPHLVKILTGIGSTLYPGLAPALKLAAGALATFDPDGVKWLQNALNEYLDLDLDVDGYVGAKTIAAVKQAQKKLGIDPDGFAGKITYAALKAALEAQKK
jgi:murein L,D-transpeptidase YcbB/YkuD